MSTSYLREAYLLPLAICAGIGVALIGSYRPVTPAPERSLPR